MQQSFSSGNSTCVCTIEKCHKDAQMQKISQITFWSAISVYVERCINQKKNKTVLSSDSENCNGNCTSKTFFCFDCANIKKHTRKWKARNLIEREEKWMENCNSYWINYYVWSIGYAIKMNFNCDRKSQSEKILLRFYSLWK
jgi:hypothetical protein